LGAGAGRIKVLGTVAGFTPFAWLDAVKAGKVQVKETLKMEPLLKQAVMKRLDGAYVSVAVANHYLDRVLAMPGALVFDPALPHSRGQYSLSTTTRPELIAEFNAWLAANQTLVSDIKKRLGAEKGVVE
jgi:polar amino acid transport system substrate-binding protein